MRVYKVVSTMNRFSKFDIEFVSDVSLPNDKFIHKSDASLLSELESAIGSKNISADPNQNQFYRKGWRSGEGAALAVLFPQTLTQLWQCLEIAVANGLIVIMQAANTGLTEGSTPSGKDYDRKVLVINTLAIDHLYLLEDAKQIVSLPGASLFQLEQVLLQHGRSPHSVIGSSCIGASIVGGIANNSGGALVKRGPAYTELAVYAKVDEQGRLVLVNHLGVYLGEDINSLLENLEKGRFDKSILAENTRYPCDKDYKSIVSDTEADTPSRFNADPRCLYETSGCAGKLAIFAVRVASHEQAQEEASFYIGTNDTADLTMLRKLLLNELNELPEVGEYMHKDMFDVAEKYGKDTFLSVKYLGTKRLPLLFNLKSRVDQISNKYWFIPNNLSDKALQILSRLFGQHLPAKMLEFRDKYEHHLIIKLSKDEIVTGEQILQKYFADKPSGEYFRCTSNEAQSAYLHRFAAAGAAIRYQILHQKTLGDILSLDIALPRNCQQWFEQLPPNIESDLHKKLYYGHFFCFVFHQDYILYKQADEKAVKQAMLNELDIRGAKYPAEHNVGHLYQAEDSLQSFYKKLDPSNTFNPGLGKMEKEQRNCHCC